jgi:hypothetical protein
MFTIIRAHHKLPKSGQHCQLGSRWQSGSCSSLYVSNPSPKAYLLTEEVVDIVNTSPDGHSSYLRDLPKSDQLCHLQSGSCSTIYVSNPSPKAYLLTEEMVVDRPVRIIGNAATLPFIDGHAVTRCFRVTVS